MRLALLLPVLFCVAAPAHAEGARESRYGPTTTRQPPAPVAAPVAAARYDGPMLNWANKRQPSTDQADLAPPATTQPAPVAAWAGYSAPPPPAAYRPPVAPAVTAAFAPRPAPQALPTSLYAAPSSPTPVAATPGPAKDWSSYRSVRMKTATPVPVQVQVQPQPQAQAPTQAPPPSPPPRQMAAASTGVTGARFYSVARESGLTPDPIPPAGPDRQVLITTDAASPPAEDAAPTHGSADWLAAGARGDDDGDDSDARRAKTRKSGL